jgi:hypothetical protein
MNWHELLGLMISGAVTAGFGWFTYTQRGAREKLHDLEIRTVRLEARADNAQSDQMEIKAELSDIRENMVRRDDLTSLRDQLCQRIDDLRS